MKPRLSPGSIVVLAICAAAIFYVLSWGPAVYLLSRYNVSHTKWPGRMFIYVFYPHLWTMAESETYFCYSMWWVEKAGSGTTTREAFQREFDNVYR